MQLIPAVDLLGGDATRLEQGDYSRELFRRPAGPYVAEVAATEPPLIHLVDLDGARSGQLRLDVLAQCVEAAGDIPVQVSGGIRSLEAARQVMGVGASRVLIGTAAFEGDLLDALVEEFGPALAVTIDVRDSMIRVKGWLESGALSVSAAADRVANAGVTRILGTAISRDGTGDGPDLDLYRQLVGYPFSVLAAGGVRNMDDVRELGEIGCEGVVTGRAFAEGRFSLSS